MEMLGNPSWRWGLSLIVLTMTIHSAAILIMAFAGARIRVRLETRRRHQWNLIAIQICATALIGLLLAVLHGIECVIWAAAYLWVGVDMTIRKFAPKTQHDWRKWNKRFALHKDHAAHSPPQRMSVLVGVMSAT